MRFKKRNRPMRSRKQGFNFGKVLATLAVILISVLLCVLLFKALLVGIRLLVVAFGVVLFPVLFIIAIAAICFVIVWLINTFGKNKRR